MDYICSGKKDCYYKKVIPAFGANPIKRQMPVAIDLPAGRIALVRTMFG